jgi:hypothetical protein
LAKTWLFPDADSGDIALDANSDTMLLPLGDSNNSTTALSSGHHISQIDFSRSSDALGISSIDSVPHPHLDPANDSLLSLHDEHLAPALINLETSGLRRSLQLAALQPNLDTPSISAYTSSTIPSSSWLISKPRPRLLFLLVFNLIGFICGLLPPWVLTLMITLSLLWLNFRMTMIVSMVYLMIRSTISAIRFMLLQLQMNLSRICKC